MVSDIAKIQQMLEESKFAEVQKEIELRFFIQGDQNNPELIELYLESLKFQSKKLPQELVLILVEKILSSETVKADQWLEVISKDKLSDPQRFLLLQIQIAEKKGQVDELYRLVAKYLLLRIEGSTPTFPEIITTIITKYFKDDFHLKVQWLVMQMMLGDLNSAEKSTEELLLTCFERSSLKGTKEKLKLLLQILSESEQSSKLTIYKNLCTLLLEGIKEKKDFKKLVELVIYVENFKIQILVLKVFHDQKIEEVATEYSQIIKRNKDYNYIYLDKYFPELKDYFFTKVKESQEEITDKVQSYEWKEAKPQTQLNNEEEKISMTEEESILLNYLKYQTYGPEELLNIAVGLIQTEYYFAAFEASRAAIDLSSEDVSKLKAYYLNVTCLLKLGEYRKAVDVSFEALAIAKTENDLLSFLYAQAESYLKITDNKKAKAVLKKITSINSNYRLARERLERLNGL